MHAEQCCARLDLVGWATSDGAVHVLSCGYWGPYLHSEGPRAEAATMATIATAELELDVARQSQAISLLPCACCDSEVVRRNSTEVSPA